MAASQKSVYVTDRTLSAIRGSADSLSGRINQIVDRYLEVLRLDQSEVRSMFSEADWRLLVSTYKRGGQFPIQAIAAIPTLLRDLEKAPSLRRAVQNLSGGDAFVLLELLEAEQIAAVVETEQE